MVVLLSSCTITIHDSQWCSPIPGNLGAVCDWSLHSEQEFLTLQQWEILQGSWIAKGEAVECTSSQTFGDIKKELEKLCSKVTCDYQIQETIKSLKKIEGLGKYGFKTH